jgi:HlyD family secretion protein
MHRPIRLVLRIGIPLLVVIVAWVALRPSPVPVETAVVDRGRVQVTVEEEGETLVHDRYSITAPVTGQLRRLTLRQGDAVSAGDALAQVEPAPLGTRAMEEARARLAAAIEAQRAARATLERARAASQQAERERERATQLVKDGLIAVEARERADLAAQTAARELDAANHNEKVAAYEVAQARAVVEPSRGNAAITLASPVAGCVLRIDDPSERVVAFGAPIMEIGDTSHLEVVADLLSNDAVRVSAGDTVEVHDWGGDSTLVAVVDVVEPSGFTKISALGVEEQRVNIRAMLANPPRQLGDRYRVMVRVVLWRGNGVLRIPRGAAIRTGGEWHAFVIEGGRARGRTIRVGQQGSGFVEVLDGLQPGDVVVMSPDERVRDGVRVGSARP